MDDVRTKDYNDWRHICILEQNALRKDATVKKKFCKNNFHYFICVGVKTLLNIFEHFYTKILINVEALIIFLLINFIFDPFKAQLTCVYVFFFSLLHGYTYIRRRAKWSRVELRIATQACATCQKIATEMQLLYDSVLKWADWKHTPHSNAILQHFLE